MESRAVACFVNVMPDGLGDADHAVNFLHALQIHQKNNPFNIIMVISYFKDKKKLLIDFLKKKRVLIEDTLETDDWKEIHKKNPGFFFVELERDDYSNDECPIEYEKKHFEMLALQEFREALASVRLIYNISNAAWLYKLEDKNNIYGYQSIF